MDRQRGESFDRTESFVDLGGVKEVALTTLDIPASVFFFCAPVASDCFMFHTVQNNYMYGRA